MKNSFANKFYNNLEKLLTKNKIFVSILRGYYQGMIVQAEDNYGSVLKCHTGKILDL